MVPLPPGLIETSHYWEVLIPKKRGTVQMLVSAQHHPQLEGLQGTLPLRHCCVLEAKHIYNALVTPACNKYVFGFTGILARME